MIKARIKDITRLKELSNELNHGLELLMSKEYEIMRPGTLCSDGKPSSTDQFTAPYYPDKVYRIITKECGSDLIPMFTAIKALNKLINNDD